MTILTFSSSSSSLPKIQKDTSSTFSYNKNEIRALYSYFHLHRMLSTKKKNSYLIIKCPSNVNLFFVQSFDEHSNSSPSRLERPPEESPFGKISSRWWCGPKEAQRANSDFNQKSPLDAIHLDRARPGQKEGRKESSLFSIALRKDEGGGEG